MTGRMGRAAARASFAPALALLLMAACSDDDPTGPLGGIQGTWELSEAELLFVHIAGEQIVVYDDNTVLDCFERSVIEIVDRDGDRYVLRAAGSSSTTEVRITRDGDRLRVETETDVVVYERSDMNVGILAVCD